VQDIAALARICRTRGVALHVDAVQALGKIGVDVAALDLCSFSAHKIGGPQGVGALYVRRGTPLRPSAYGGSQERGIRPGTENVAAIVGFGEAARGCRPHGEEIVTLRERLWRGLRPQPQLRRNSGIDDCLPNTLHVSVVGSNAEGVVAALDLEGVAVSAGAACSAGAAEPSHVLRALGRSTDEAREGIRFSLGRRTTSEHIDAAVAAVARVLSRLESRVTGCG
jgi:cysteine desulfurase